MSTRLQLSLFVPEPVATILESVRRVLDPVQASLIPAHVTLCREDELVGVDEDALRSRIAAAPLRQLVLDFGAPEPFSGHGILLPCVAGEPEFQQVRRWILASASVRRLAPHITLAHPRNPKAVGNDLQNAAALAGGTSATFEIVHRIEQVGSAPWRITGTYRLGVNAARAV